MQLDMRSVIIALASLGTLGLIFGAGLAIAAKKFAVPTDPLYDEVLGALPGVNCGGCGYPGCAAYAAAVARGEVGINLCPVGGNDLLVNLAKIMKLEPAATLERQVATPYCDGGAQEAGTRFLYAGILDCVVANAMSGGDKDCQYGCLGYGSCVKMCVFGAISMDENRIPVVNEAKCTACGMCVKGCPKHIFALRPSSMQVHIRCRSHDKGKDVRKKCSVGCIACGLCVRACPVKAITMENNLAVIDYTLCTNCGLCIEKCPMKTIHGPLSAQSTK
ncbi:MAG: Electron transport complex subunit RsxB [Firmicutes bacterium]|nr:Electron transport complex subunit RsxB [Bacillota bacterium]